MTQTLKNLNKLVLSFLEENQDSADVAQSKRLHVDDDEDKYGR